MDWEENDKLIFKFNQNKTYLLLTDGNNLVRKEDRVNASHKIYVMDNNPVISDGLVTYRKVSCL